MDEAFVYLLKVSSGLAIISISYLLFLRKDTNLLIKRFYLLFGIFASCLFPFLKLFSLPAFLQLGQQVSSAPFDFQLPLSDSISYSGTTAGPDIRSLIIIIYFLGALILLVRNIALFIKWKREWNRCGSSRKNIAYTESGSVFTLLSWIFIPKKYKNDPQIDSIIFHEKAHIHQLHIIDLIITELALLITWFNPFTWLISRMIKENHEHLADREVLSKGINPAHYKAQLLNFSLGINLFRLGHQFSYSLTKTRFKMMKKTKSNRTDVIKYFLLIPFVVLMLGTLTSSKSQEQDGIVKGKVIFKESGEPVQGASVFIIGTTIGTITNNKGEFIIDCKGYSKPVICISYVGYDSYEIKASGITEKPIELKHKSEVISIKTESGTDKKPGSISIRALDHDEDAESPVIVVDGKVVDGMSDINNNDIESIQVIKDTSSELAKKYNAKNGLIIVKLKKR